MNSKYLIWSKILSFILICYLLALFTFSIGKEDERAIEGMTDSEKVEYLMTSGDQSLVELILIAVIVGGLIIALNRLFIWVFQKVFFELSKTRRVE